MGLDAVGDRVSIDEPATTCWAKAPTITLPKTRSPTTTSRTPSATSTTAPAKSLPGTNGGDTEIWYWLAITSTSGKFTAAAWTRTLTSPGPGRGSATSRTFTVSGGP